MSTTSLIPFEKTEAPPTQIPVKTYRKPIPIKKKPLEVIELRRRQWLLQRGKIAARKFKISAEQQAKLHEYFISLDLDNSGSISADEL